MLQSICRQLHTWICLLFIAEVQQSSHTASAQADDLLDILFCFSPTILLSKIKTPFFNLCTSPNVTNLSVDYEGTSFTV